MRPYGSLCVHHRPYGSLWVLINLYKSFWVFMGPYVSFASIWVLMGAVGPYKFFCVPMDSNGSLCFCGSLSVYMGPLGSLLVFMSHCSSVWNLTLF